MKKISEENNIEFPPYDNSKKVNKKISTWKHVREFSDNTSIHGIKYIGEDNRHWVERFVWLLMFITSTVICGYLVSKLWYKWSTSPVIVSFSETSTPIWEIPFPAVTICPESKVHPSEYNFKNILYKQYDLTEQETQELNKALLLCNDNYVIINKSLTVEDDIIKFFERVAPPFAGAIILCDLFEVKINCTNLFKPIITDGGICYTFNMVESNFFEMDQIKMKVDFKETRNILRNLHTVSMYSASSKGDSNIDLNIGKYLSNKQEKKTNESILRLNDTLTNSLNFSKSANTSEKKWPLYDSGVKKYRLTKNDEEIENIKIKTDQQIWALDSGYIEDPPEYVVPLRADGSGNKYSLKIYTNIERGTIDHLCHSIEGFKVILHNPAETPRMDMSHFYLPIKQGVVVAIKPDMMTTSETLWNYSPQQRQCFFPQERRLEYHSTYTQINCKIECISKAILKDCNCAIFYMPRDNSTKVCGPGMKKCIKKAKLSAMKKETTSSSDKCNCLPACTSLQYNVETSQVSLNLDEIFNALQFSVLDRFRYQTSILSVYFKESQFFTSRRSELYGLTDFLANCGGLLGLCIGFSVLSLMEIIYFLSIRPVYYFGRYKINTIKEETKD